MTSNWRRAFDEAAGVDPNQCPTCWPGPHPPLILLMAEGDPYEQWRCSSCGERVDQSGRRLGTRDGHFKHVILADDDDVED